MRMSVAGEPPKPDANGNLDVSPTGTCFDDACENMAHLCLVVERRKDVMMVHGIVELRAVGKPFSHAWVEHGDQVYQCGIFGNQLASYSISKSYFGEIYKVIDCSRYDFVTTLAMDRLLGPPPWEEKYRRLCSDHKAKA